VGLQIDRGHAGESSAFAPRCQKRFAAAAYDRFQGSLLRDGAGSGKRREHTRERAIDLENGLHVERYKVDADPIEPSAQPLSGGNNGLEIVDHL
jgi:hypothetical protein